MHTEDIEYHADGARLVGQYVVDDDKPGKRPGVLVCHEGPGLTPRRSRRVSPCWAMPPSPWTITATVGRSPTSPTRGSASLRESPTRPGIRARATAALEVLKARKEVDTTRLAAIGYCFGGTTSLELGRAGCDLKAIVGFHSGLVTVRPQDARNIKGKVLVCIGADDPIIPPEQRAAFETEMKAAGIDWRLQLYGGAGHSFTNPAADSRGMEGFFYHEATDRRSWNAMIELFNETLK